MDDVRFEREASHIMENIRDIVRVIRTEEVGIESEEGMRFGFGDLVVVVGDNDEYCGGPWIVVGRRDGTTIELHPTMQNQVWTFVEEESCRPALMRIRDILNATADTLMIAREFDIEDEMSPADRDEEDWRANTQNANSLRLTAAAAEANLVQLCRSLFH